MTDEKIDALSRIISVITLYDMPEHEGFGAIDGADLMEVIQECKEWRESHATDLNNPLAYNPNYCVAKDALKEHLKNCPNTRPQAPSGDAVDGKDYKKLYWDLLESWSDLKIKHGVLQEKLEAALTQPKADVEGLKKPEPIFYETDSDYQKGHKRGQQRGWNDCIDHLAAQGYIGVPEGWRDIAEIPDNLISGVDLLGSTEKRYINCTFDLRVQAWADENFNFVEIPTHWMPIPAAPKKEGMR